MVEQEPQALAILREQHDLSAPEVRFFIEDCAKALVFTVTDNASAETAQAKLKAAKAIQRHVEDARKAITSELDAKKKALIAKERQLLAPLTEAADALRGNLDAFMRRKAEEQERARQEAAAKAAQAQAELERAQAIAASEDPSAQAVADAQERAAAAIEAASATTEQAKQAFAKVQGVSIKTTWDFNVINPDAVPRRFLVVDTQAIRLHIQQLKKSGMLIANVKIPGINVFERTSTILR